MDGILFEQEVFKNQLLIKGCAANHGIWAALPLTKTPKGRQ